MADMSFLDRGVLPVKIVDIGRRAWGINCVTVAGRPFHALVYRRKGSATFTVDGTAVCPPSCSITYMPARKQYTAAYDEPNDIIYIHFEADISEPAELFIPPSPERFLSLFERAQTAWENKTGAYYFNAAALVYEIFGKLSALSEERTTDTQSSFLTAVSYMHEHFTDPELTVASLVRLSHMSNTYFRKLFQQKFCTTPSKYLSDLRTGYAEQLLATGQYNVTEAALASGFYDPKYFSRVLKRRFGAPPSRLYGMK